MEYQGYVLRKVFAGALIRHKKGFSGQYGIQSWGHLICFCFSDRCKSNECEALYMDRAA